MTRKIRIGIIFGGKSVEHEVSIQSAKNVFEALDKEKYEPILMGIDKEGNWHLSQPEFLIEKSQEAIPLSQAGSDIVLISSQSNQKLMQVENPSLRSGLDVVFPVLHGTYGEDGTIQGLLKLWDIPFVGASVLGSAVGMDKDVTKRLLRDAGVPIAPYRCLTRKDLKTVTFTTLSEEFGVPFFIKPANTGSSVGISKVKNEAGFQEAIENAFRYDRKILCEKYIAGREIEIAILGGETPTASLPGEIIPHHEFYSYEAKYLDENGATLAYPAKLEPSLIRTLQEAALKVFDVLCCEIMARVDFFVTEQGEYFLNEINTIPGFTNISMYPKLWEVSGIGYADLVDRLIKLALERHHLESKLLTSYSQELSQK